MTPQKSKTRVPLKSKTRIPLKTIIDASLKHPTDTPLKSACPYCNKVSYVVKIGKRKTKTEILQRYKCKTCNKTFSNRPLKFVTYRPEIIFTAISYYNLGYTKKEASRTLSKKFKVQVPIPTIHSWTKRYQDICTFTGTLRKRYILDPKTLIFSKKFHHQQVYEFKYHTLKLNIAGKKFPKLKSYIKSVSKKCPDKPFKHGPRCSDLRIDLKPTKITKHNKAPKLAEFAQTLTKTNRSRHTQVENFMLINDSATIAIEVPVYLYPNEISKQEKTTLGLHLTEPLSGHIDILQVRWDKIHILDYKSDAKRTDKSAAEQVFLYALALSKRSGIPINKFLCAYFDDKNYFQFTLD